MARKNKATFKENKTHGGKEFSNKFHFVGQVFPVQKKDEGSESWYDVEIYDNTVTRTGRNRKVIQFLLETASFNRLKIELAGMEQDNAYLYSMTTKQSSRIDWANRHDKTKYPDETYFLIDTDWDKTEKFGNVVKEGIWVDVKGHYEFDTFTTDDNKEIKLVKRIIDNVAPLKNGEVVITEVKSGDVFRAYDENNSFLGQGKADASGAVSIRVGWLNPEGGKLYVCKLNADKSDGTLSEQAYNEDVVQNGKITITNNLTTSPVRVDKASGGYEYIDYTMDFRNADFKEVNSFEMQLGIRSTYQDETTLDTIVNGVYLDYGKARSTPKDVELIVYHKEADVGNTALATAFSRLNPLDYMVVEGVDNNRAETTMIEVEETEEDNPFEDVGEKTVSYEEVSAGTKKGLEIKSYVTGTYHKELLTEEEISHEVSMLTEDPFANTVIEEDDLPF
jgi:hypothetical protein